MTPPTVQVKISFNQLTLSMEKPRTATYEELIAEALTVFCIEPRSDYYLVLGDLSGNIFDKDMVELLLMLDAVLELNLALYVLQLAAAKTPEHKRPRRKLTPERIDRRIEELLPSPKKLKYCAARRLVF